MTIARYDSIGGVYSRHRHADPRIARTVCAALGDAWRIVNVGAGTGSYEPADRHVVAVDSSALMIGQRPPGAAPVVQASAESLPFPSGAFDAALAVFSVHHWPDRTNGLREFCRVAPRRVVLGFEPRIHNDFWLIRDYVPAAAEVPSTRDVTVDEIAEAIDATRVEIVDIPSDCIDGFGWAYWRRPEAYLDPEVRSCISCLAQLTDDDVAPGLGRLSRDLESGAWHERYASLLTRATIDGGYRLIIRD